MKTNKIYLFLFIGLLFLSGCDNGFEEMNVNPNSPTSVPADLLIPGITTAAMNNMYSTFVGGDMGAIWAQQISKVQYNDEERFYPRTSVINSFWNNMYEDVISDANKMYTLAEAEGNNNLMGIALVLKAYGFSVVTDCYGNVPFSQALEAEAGNFKPAYDSQSEVYTGILAMLDDAAALLGTGGDVSATSDVIYHGDVTKWKKFANSLKFRSLMRISGKVDVTGQLQALYDGGMLFASNDDEAKLIYTSAQPNANPIYETIVYGTRNEFKACSTMTDLMAGKGDARLNVYFSDDTDSGTIVGKTPGIADVPNATYNYTTVSPVGDFYLRPEAPGFFMSYPELEFLIAEAALQSYITGADANTHFTNGIVASYEANGLTTGASYAASQGNASLQKIGEEKYVALYWQGIEVWTEWRRTGFPALQPVADANPSYTEALRYYYNSVEASINADSYNDAVAAQGADLLSTPVWWMP
jgi:hypothetical protein